MNKFVINWLTNQPEFYTTRHYPTHIRIYGADFFSATGILIHFCGAFGQFCSETRAQILLKPWGIPAGYCNNLTTKISGKVQYKRTGSIPAIPVLTFQCQTLSLKREIKKSQERWKQNFYESAPTWREESLVPVIKNYQYKTMPFDSIF